MNKPYAVSDAERAKRERFLRQELPRLYSYSRRYDRSLTGCSSEDIVHEVFLRPGHIERTWNLETDQERRVYLNVAVDFMARERMKARAEAQLDAGEMVDHSHDSLIELRKIYNALSLVKNEKARLAFLLRFENDLTYEQIGRLVEVKNANLAKQLVIAARNDIRRLIFEVDGSRFEVGDSDLHVDHLLELEMDEIRILDRQNNTFNDAIRALPNRAMILLFDCRDVATEAIADVIRNTREALDNHGSLQSVSTVFVVVPFVEPDDLVSLTAANRAVFLECSPEKTNKEILKQYKLNLVSSISDTVQPDPPPTERDKAVSRRVRDIVDQQFSE